MDDAPATHRLAIRLLGPLEVDVDGARLVVDTRKALAILALLAAERRPFARDELAALLWPESDDESARGALRRTLSVLRAALGDRWLRVDRAMVELDPDGLDVDLDLVTEAASSGDVRLIGRAATLARGPFLAGFTLRDSPGFDDWRATRAAAVDRTVGAVLDRLVALTEAAGDVQTAVSAAMRRVDLDPLDEASHRRAMALFARTGDRAGAIRQYRACVAVLERELGVAPLHETTELYEAIRDALPLPELVPMASATVEARAARGPRSPDAGAAPGTGIDLAVPAASRASLPMVGREVELSRLVALHGSAAHDGRVALVVGEAGIGKSRLVEALATEVERTGGTALVVRAYASEEGIAYGPVVELLRAAVRAPAALRRVQGLPPAIVADVERLVSLPELGGHAPALPPRLDPSDPGGRTRLLEAVATFLTAAVDGRTEVPISGSSARSNGTADATATGIPGTSPGLVAVEDLQWADAATRESLVWLARRLAGRPLLLLLTWRPEDLDALGAELAQELEALPSTEVVALQRFDRDAVERLVDAAADAGLGRLDPGPLLDESEGLPLFIVEALRASSGAPPDPHARTVRGLLRERLASVGETASQLLAAAAVIGRSFDLSLVRSTSGRTEDETIAALEELVRRGIVREVEAGRDVVFDFAHAKLREAAYDATGLARRRLLHRRAAEALRADPGARDDAVRLVQVATHERAAGREAEAAVAFRDAGERARAIYALHEAGAHLETALALGHPDVVAIQTSIGEIRTAQGDYGAAIAVLESAAALADPATLPEVELRLGRAHARRGDNATAASHLDAAIATLEARGDGDGLLSRILIDRAAVSLRAGALDEAGTTAARALALAEGTSDPVSEGAAHRILGLVARERGDLEAARAALRASLAFAEGGDDPGTAIAAANALALVAAEAGERDTAIALLERALEDCRRTGERHLEAAVANNLADQLHAAGREPESMELLKRAVALFAEVGGPPGVLEPEIWKLATW